MTALAGETIIAGKVPGERIATDTETADSATFTTTETVVMTVVAPLVIGRTYRVTMYGKANSSVGTDDITWRIREDNVTGSEMQSDRVEVAGSATTGRKISMEVEHTASATADKTFVVTGVRSTGTGNHFLEANSARPVYLYVDYIRG